MSDEDVRTEFAKAIAEAARAGQWEDVRRLTDALLKVVGAHAIDVDRTFVNVQGQPDMTPAQVAKRARRIAEGHAHDDPRKRAVSKSKWRSVANYAEKRFGLARSTFSQYMSGKVAPPDDVKTKVAQDFPGVDFWTPPAKS